MKTFPIPCEIAVVLISSAAFANPTPLKDNPAWQAKLAQEKLAQESVKTRSQLAEIAKELKEFFPDETALVDQTLADINNLSNTEILRAAESLKTAATEKEASKRQESLTSAVRDQSTVEQKLQELWTSLGAPKTRQDLLDGARAIARQQSIALAEARTLAMDPESMSSARRDALQNEQDRLAMVSDHLAKKINELGPSESASAFAESAKAAAKSLRAGDVSSSVTNQGRALDSLENMMTGLDAAAGKPDADRLDELKREMEVLANMQQTVNRHLQGGNAEAARLEQEHAVKLAAALSPATSQLPPETRQEFREAAKNMENTARSLSEAGQKGPSSGMEAPENSNAASKGVQNVLSQVSKAIAAAAKQSASQSPSQGSPELGKSASPLARGAQAPSAPSSNRPQGQGQESAQASQPSTSQEQAEESSAGGLGESTGLVKSSAPSGADGSMLSILTPGEREAAARMQSLKPPPGYEKEVATYFKNLAEGTRPPEKP